ncbi:MAG TPA: ECF-type sigma factor [Gemmatimonadaceae bacterium]|nr:ECF-type sigma factor [Gemmatimonadaceae bacterium]
MPKHDIALSQPQVDLQSGRTEALDAVVALAYRELRSIAHRRLFERRTTGTLSTTALVHEAYLKLADQSVAGWSDRPHFLALASLAMRHVLVDRARELNTQKRGGAPERITLNDEEINVEAEPEILLQLNEAMDRLAMFEPRLAHVVECRFFGGLTEKETAEALAITVRTVQRDWVKARVLLRRALES